MRRVIENPFTSADGFAADRAEEATWITDEFGEESSATSRSRTGWT
jgi:hypothetical protein